MAIPKYYELQRPFLKVLSDGNEYRLLEIKELIANICGLSDEDITKKYPSGNTFVFSDRVHWAALHLRKAELINSPNKGVYVITEKGKDVLEKGPEIIDFNYLKSISQQYKQFVTPKTDNGNNQSNNDDVQTSENDNDTGQGQIESAFDKLKKEKLEEIKGEIMSISDQAFEYLATDVVAKAIFGNENVNIIVTQKSNDKGIDGIITDELGLETIYVQVKQYSDNNVGSSDMRDFAGSFAHKKGKGVFVTTSNFTKEAMECAELNGIAMIDGEKLLDLMFRHNLGVSVSQIYEVKELDYGFFDKYKEIITKTKN